MQNESRYLHGLIATCWFPSAVRIFHRLRLLRLRSFRTCSCFVNLVVRTLVKEIFFGVISVFDKLSVKKMYTKDLDYSSSSEQLKRLPSTPSALSERPQWLSHISESSRRRQQALLLKQRKEKLRRRRMVRRMEYQRLRNMVPSIAAKPLVSKVTVIEEAIRYIDYLHVALLNRLRTKGLPSCLRGADVNVNELNLDGLKDLVCQLVQKNSQQKKRLSPDPLDPTPVSVFERSRLVPSYLTAKRPLRKRT